MSGQLLELLIFAGIAVFLINKLVSMLGTSNEDDPSKRFKNKSFFGESRTGSKHVHSVVSDISQGEVRAYNQASINPDLIKQSGFILKGKEKDVAEGLNGLTSKLPSFDLAKFYKNSKIAFDFIIKAAVQNNQSELQELIDPRYIERFKEISVNYTDLLQNISWVKYNISEIYMFGNTAFIKLLFTLNNTEGTNRFNEEWTFSRNILSNGKAWYLSNIDKI